MLGVMVRLIRYCPQTCLTCIDDMKDTRLREFYVKDCNIHIVFFNRNTYIFTICIHKGT